MHPTVPSIRIWRVGNPVLEVPVVASICELSVRVVRRDRVSSPAREGDAKVAEIRGRGWEVYSVDEGRNGFCVGDGNAASQWVQLSYKIAGLNKT